MCEESWKVGLLGSAIFIGWASTLLWVPRFGDQYGRKTVFAVGMSLNLLMYTIMMWTRDINVMLVSLFMQGALTSVRMNIGYLYMLELMPKHSRTSVGSLFGVMDSSIYLLATLYFWKVGKDWYFVCMMGYMLNLLSAIASWFIPESPSYLLETGKISELEQVMQTIATVNGKPFRFNREHFTSEQASVKDEESNARISVDAAQPETSSSYFLKQRSI